MASSQNIGAWEDLDQGAWQGAAASSGTNMFVNIGDSWKAVTAVKINIGDSWKSVVSAKINIGDTWKTIF